MACQVYPEKMEFEDNQESEVLQEKVGHLVLLDSQESLVLLDQQENQGHLEKLDLLGQMVYQVKQEDQENLEKRVLLDLLVLEENQVFLELQVYQDFQGSEVCRDYQ